MTLERSTLEVQRLDIRKLASAEGLYFSLEYPFPYTPEEFNEDEKAILLKHFTNCDKPIYAIIDMEQEVAGALLSRFSRAKESPRRIFLKEFYGDPLEGVKILQEYLVEELGEDEESATDKAESLYRKTLSIEETLEEKGKERKRKFFKTTLAEYGDDSVIQMGSVHLIFEGVSQIAAKAIEDARVASSFIEKSTRYVRFDQLVNGRFLFTNAPELMGAEFEAEYEDWNKACFEAYTSSIDPTKEYLRGKYPLEEIGIEDKKTGETLAFSEIVDEDKRELVKKAYENALRAKALDLVRCFLPTTTVTNLGAHFSGQAAEHSINKLLSSQYKEVQLVGLMALEEAWKVIPSFLERVPGRYGLTERDYLRELNSNQEAIAHTWEGLIPISKKKNRTRLVDWDEHTDVRIASQIIYTHQTSNLSKREIIDWATKIKRDDLAFNPNSRHSSRLAKIIESSIPDRGVKGRNRRHKLPRAFEHAFFEVEFNGNFGGYRDLQRNRMSTTERQKLSAKEVDVPQEFHENGMEKVLEDYLKVADRTRNFQNRILSKGGENAGEYVTILGNLLRYNVRANIRQWAFFSELRTIDSGHKDYRWVMQSAVKQILYVAPFLKQLFTHINWKKDYGLGRLKAEIRTQEKLSS